MQLIAMACLVSRTRIALGILLPQLVSSFNLEEKKTLHRYIYTCW